MSDTVMIAAGETSGELYGALLAAYLSKKAPGAVIIGIGGERMAAAGVNLIAGISHAFGLSEAVSSLRILKETFRKAKDALVNARPAVLVLIDYPDFNLQLAAEARRLGIPVLYYVSPQVWAWRRGRVKKIARLADRMAVILPFEVDVYRGTGLTCEFVGHPIMDEIRELSKTKEEIREELGLDRERPLLSLLPGSRPHELDRLLPVIEGVVKGFRKEFPEFQFCVPFAPNTQIGKYEESVNALGREGVLVNKGASLKVLAASDAAVIASGTASLQAVLLGVPTVVMYRISPPTYWLGRLILKVRHISLVNILSGSEVVREFLQKEASPDTIISELRRMITDASYRRKMLDSFVSVREMFSGRNASERVADIIIDMAGWKNG